MRMLLKGTSHGFYTKPNKVVNELLDLTEPPNLVFSPQTKNEKPKSSSGLTPVHWLVMCSFNVLSGRGVVMHVTYYQSALFTLSRNAANNSQSCVQVGLASNRL